MLELLRAARSLRRSPGFAAVVVLTLALGIGGNTAIVSVAHVMFFAPLPFPHSDRLVRIRATNVGPGGEENAFNLRGAEIFALEKSSPFSDLVSMAVQDRTLIGGEAPERISVATYYGDWEQLLGVRPVLGRWFTAEEEHRGDTSGVIAISTELWARRFGSAPDVLGRSITLDSRTLTVIGVLPEGFHFPYTAEAWTPASMVSRSVDDYAVFGRLKDGVEPAAASQALAVVAADLARQFPETYGGARMGLKLWPVRESFVGDQKQPARAIAAVGVFFLLLACFNVANLCLVRSVGRAREMQIRAALGASRWHLIRQNLAETLLLALGGAGLGILLAAYVSPNLVSFVPVVLTRQLNMAVQPIGWFSLAVALVLSLFTTVAAGVLPAVSSATLARAEGAGRSGTRTSRSRGERYLMNALVVLEFTLALALIAGAGLMARNFSSLLHHDLGIDTAHLLSLRVSTTDPRYAPAAAKQRLVDGVLSAAESTPGVSAAGVGTVNPLGGTNWSAPIAIEGREVAGSGATYVVNHRLITPRWFEAMGIRLLQGRAFTDNDNESAPGVAIISRNMAARYWPNGDALGKRVRVNRPGRAWLQIVGVVSNVDDFTGGDGPHETWYLPYAQNAASAAAIDMVLMVRTPGDPRAIQQSVERSIHRTIADVALYDASTLDRYYLDTLSQQRTSSIFISVLAAFGLLLGSLGLYGTLSFTVGERVREIGIRMALGAGRREILRMVMMQGLRLSIFGTVLGMCAALALGRTLASQLSQVKANDPLALVFAAGVLLVVACGAIYWPARRAAKLDPNTALRSE